MAGSDPVPVVAVVGPTAAGKSDLAVELAIRFRGEVVSADSMQLYRGMDIGTAKLPIAARRGVAHHLLDLLDVTEPATVAEFQRWARASISDCMSRDAVPVVVGGSALYVRAVVDDFVFPGTDPLVRDRLERQLAELGVAEMHDRLARVDPRAAATILPTNGRRIVRALEVVELTGRPFRAALPDHTSGYDRLVLVGIDVPRDVLDQRISERVQRMWDDGFVEEVRRLRVHGLARGRTASRALGYRQVLAHLDGRCTEEQAYADTVTRTRRFARRQDSWFRRDPRIRWLRYDDQHLADHAADLIRGARRAGRRRSAES